MKRIIFLICFVMTLFTAEAQTIHWLTFIDTNDKRVGKIDVVGRNVLYSHFINEVNAALAPKGYKSNILDFYGDRVTPENCKAAVEMLRVDKDDIIVFYYIGHGARPATDPRNDDGYMVKHPYPQMCMQLKFHESKYIPLEWVYKQLSSKGARLSVTIGMCCNSLANISIKEGPTFSPNYGVTKMSKNKIERIQDLFLKVKGNVLSTSASPTQNSGCFYSEFGEIDCYTTVLCQFFKSALDDYSKTLTWDDLLNTISAVIDRNTNGSQTPIHETHLVSASVPSVPVPKVPTQQQIQKTQQRQSQGTKQQGNGGEWTNELTDLLDMLINTNMEVSKRKRIEELLGELFADNANVRFLAQDSDISVDREEAPVFLGRLATTDMLLKVQVIEGAFNGENKITSLKVREVYRQD